MIEPGEADLSKVETVPVAGRPNKVRADDFASPPPPDRASFGAFLDSLPDILEATGGPRWYEIAGGSDVLVRALRASIIAALHLYLNFYCS